MKDNKNIWCVYKHTNKINGKCYIGITKTIPEKRWGKNGIGYKYQNFWYAIKKYGWNNFEHEILFCNLTEKECKDKEIQLIKKYNSIAPNGYNITHGGDGSLGLFPNEKTKEKQSLSAKKRTDLKKEVICFETLETFNSATDCSLYINVDRSNITNLS